MAKAHRLAGALLPAHDYIRAQRIRRHIADAFDELAGHFDAIVSPTIGTTASSRYEDFEYMLPGSFPRAVNFAGVLTGSPTISVPNGLGRAGCPPASPSLARACGERHPRRGERPARTVACGAGGLRPPAAHEAARQDATDLAATDGTATREA